jgi:hypothetical protein
LAYNFLSPSQVLLEFKRCYPMKSFWLDLLWNNSDDSNQRTVPRKLSLLCKNRNFHNIVLSRKNYLKNYLKKKLFWIDLLQNRDLRRHRVSFRNKWLVTEQLRIFKSVSCFGKYRFSHENYVFCHIILCRKVSLEARLVMDRALTARQTWAPRGRSKVWIFVCFERCIRSVEVVWAQSERIHRAVSNLVSCNCPHSTHHTSKVDRSSQKVNCGPQFLYPFF